MATRHSKKRKAEKRQRFAVAGEKGAPLRWRDLCRVVGRAEATTKKVWDGKASQSPEIALHFLMDRMLSQQARNAVARARAAGTYGRRRSFQRLRKWVDAQARKYGPDTLISKKYPFVVKAKSGSGTVRKVKHSDLDGQSQQVGRDGAEVVEGLAAEDLYLPPGTARDHMVSESTESGDEGTRAADGEQSASDGAQGSGQGAPQSSGDGQSQGAGESPISAAGDGRSTGDGGGETSSAGGDVRERESNQTEGPASVADPKRDGGEARAGESQSGDAQPADREGHSGKGGWEPAGDPLHPTLCECQECQAMGTRGGADLDGNDARTGERGEASSPTAASAGEREALAPERGQAGGDIGAESARERRMAWRKQEREQGFKKVGGAAFGGRTGESHNIKRVAEEVKREANEVVRALERMMEKWEPSGTGRTSFRVAPRRLAVECEGGMRLARAHRREMTPGLFVMMVDTSGSCGAVSEPLMGAAVAVAKVDKRVVVIEYSNEVFVAAFGGRKDLVGQVTRAAAGLVDRWSDCREIWKMVAGWRPAVMVVAGDDHGQQVYPVLEARGRNRVVVVTHQLEPHHIRHPEPTEVYAGVQNAADLARVLSRLRARTATQRAVAGR